MQKAKHYWICTVTPGGRPYATPSTGPRRIGCERTVDRVDIAADNGGVEVGPGQGGIPIEEPHRRVLGADVIRSATHVMIWAGVVEKPRRG